MGRNQQLHTIMTKQHLPPPQRIVATVISLLRWIGCSGRREEWVYTRTGGGRSGEGETAHGRADARATHGRPVEMFSKSTTGQKV